MCLHHCRELLPSSSTHSCPGKQCWLRFIVTCLEEVKCWTTVTRTRLHLLIRVWVLGAAAATAAAAPLQMGMPENTFADVWKASLPDAQTTSSGSSQRGGAAVLLWPFHRCPSSSPHLICMILFFRSLPEACDHRWGLGGRTDQWIESFTFYGAQHRVRYKAPQYLWRICGVSVAQIQHTSLSPARSSWQLFAPQQQVIFLSVCADVKGTGSAFPSG